MEIHVIWRVVATDSLICALMISQLVFSSCISVLIYSLVNAKNIPHSFGCSSLIVYQFYSCWEDLSGSIWTRMSCCQARFQYQVWYLVLQCLSIIKILLLFFFISNVLEKNVKNSNRFSVFIGSALFVFLFTLFRYWWWCGFLITWAPEYRVIIQFAIKFNVSMVEWLNILVLSFWSLVERCLIGIHTPSSFL